MELLVGFGIVALTAVAFVLLRKGWLAARSDEPPQIGDVDGPYNNRRNDDPGDGDE